MYFVDTQKDTFQRTVPQLSLDLSREFPVIIKGKLCDLFREFYSIVNIHPKSVKVTLQSFYLLLLQIFV